MIRRRKEPPGFTRRAGMRVKPLEPVERFKGVGGPAVEDLSTARPAPTSSPARRVNPGGSLVLLLLLASLAPAETADVDLLVVGGTESGWAAAIQAARQGVDSIALVNDIEWLGGQFSAEAVGAIDENRGMDGSPFPRSGLFAEIIDRIMADNVRLYGDESPGNAWTSRTQVRPAQAARLFREMIEPYVESGRIRLYSNYYPVSATLLGDGKTVEVVRFRSTVAGEPELAVRAKMTIDASDWGDVIQAAGADFEVGVDPRSRYGEPNAPVDLAAYPPTDMNPITYSLVITETGDGEPIPRPKHFDDRRYYLTSDVTKEDYHALGWPFPPHRMFNPPWTPLSGVFYEGDRSVYSQRRLVDRYNLDIEHPDVLSLVWTLQDYPLDVLPQHVVDALEADEPGASRKNVAVMSRRQRQMVFEDAKQHSLGMLYHLQTTVHERMEDRAHSFRRFELTDEFPTADGCPPKPYVRESIRLKAMYMMREQDARHFEEGVAAGTPAANESKGSKLDRYANQMYYDAVAGWQFPYDFHMTGRMFLGKDQSGPWASYFKSGRSWRTQSDRAVFPLRSLIPERVDGLLGAQKNLGYSSIVSSAVRLHDQSIAVGQAAGALAAVALETGEAPRAFPYDLELLSRVQRALASRHDGGEPAMLWPFRDIGPDDPAYEAANLLAAHQLLPLGLEDVDFRPGDPADAAWREQVAALTRQRFPAAPAPPAGELTRGAFARRWWTAIADLEQTAPGRFSALDADNDGIVDRDDPAPFDSDHDGRMNFLEPGVRPR